jgi:hypothetical protein
MLVTPTVCIATTTQERWETADLIVEGRIIETKTILDNQVSIIKVDRILKTETIEMSPAYAKGAVAELEIQVPASNIDPEATHILFLKETDTGYKITYSEEADTPKTPPLISPEASGLTALILLTLSVLRIDKRE